MNKKSAIMIGIMTAVLLVAVGLTVYIVRQQQTIRSSAQTVPAGTQPTATTAPTGSASPTVTSSPTVTGSTTPTGACQLPAQVSNVKISYPHCQ